MPTTAAFGVAEDWLNSDRVDRVVIISADDVTGDDLWEWIGGGFAASGAAATGNVVEEGCIAVCALRRNGLVLGMGAAAFVVERHSQAAEREFNLLHYLAPRLRIRPSMVLDWMSTTLLKP